jgi:hypothetical protein
MNGRDDPIGWTGANPTAELIALAVFVGWTADGDPRDDDKASHARRVYHQYMGHECSAFAPTDVRADR